jgi:glyoxylase-like metal-dependent hydrolase (beta-lactamase superfamily II)
MSGTLTVHNYDAAHELGLERAEALQEPSFAAASRRKLTGLLESRLHINVDGQSRAIRWRSLEALPDRQSLRLSFSVGSAARESLEVEARLFPADEMHQTFVNLYQGGALALQSIVNTRAPYLRYFPVKPTGRLAAVPAAARSGGGPGFAPVETIEKVADNLYRIPGGGGNSAVWVRNDGVLLVDTKVANNGPKLLELIRSVTDKPVTHIINTHTHGDHVGSNAFFPTQVEVVVQENTAAHMRKMEVFNTAEGAAGRPDKTFKQRLTLFSGREAVDLYYFGAAHTDGDALVVFRSARVMHAGDMFAGKLLPIIDAGHGGSGLHYGETIDKAARAIKNVERVITGHSDVMSWQDFVDYGEFNRQFLAHERAQFRAGKTAQQALDNYQLPAKFQAYMLGSSGGPFGGIVAVEATFAELKKAGRR